MLYTPSEERMITAPTFKGKDNKRGIKSILFVHNARTSFVQLDMEILRERYELTEAYLRARRVAPHVIWRQVRRHSLVFGWFASWHMLLPVLFARLQRKPALLIIGGYDLANLPQIGYGHQRGGLKRWLSRTTMRMASHLITYSFYNREEAEHNAGIPQERVHVIYLGVPDLFKDCTPETREALVLTVGNVDRANLWRKGHEPFVRAAALLPGIPFALVGTWKDDTITYLRSIATPNVCFVGRVDDRALLDYYRRAAVYVQASQHEGFGMSVAEAMLAGCIPVATRAGALPEVIGDAGIFVDSAAPEQLAEHIRLGLQAPAAARWKARERVLRGFSLEQRRESLFRLITQIDEESDAEHRSIGPALSGGSEPDPWRRE